MTSDNDGASVDLVAALEDSQQSFQRLLERLRDFVCQLEISPDGTGRLLYASSNTDDVFGPGFVLGDEGLDQMMAMVHEDDRDVLNEFFEKMVRESEAEAEYRIVGTDGELRWTWNRVSMRHQNGYTYVDAICTNISARRALTEERNKAEQLRLDMVTMLSDRIGNALAGVVGFTELALTDDTLNAETRSFLDRVRTSSADVDSARRDLLALCMIDAGQLFAARQATEVLATLAIPMQINDVALQPTGVKDAVAWMHPLHLAQILDNLLSNASKFAGGATAIEIVRVDHKIQVRVSDEGSGVNIDLVPHLFDRHVHNNQALLDGVGVGLFISKALAEANQASLWYEPNAERGSVFVLEMDDVVG